MNKLAEAVRTILTECKFEGNLRPPAATEIADNHTIVLNGLEIGVRYWDSQQFKAIHLAKTIEKSQELQTKVYQAGLLSRGIYGHGYIMIGGNRIIVPQSDWSAREKGEDGYLPEILINLED